MKRFTFSATARNLIRKTKRIAEQSKARCQSWWSRLKTNAKTKKTMSIVVRVAGIIGIVRSVWRAIEWLSDILLKTLF